MALLRQSEPLKRRFIKKTVEITHNFYNYNLNMGKCKYADVIPGSEVPEPVEKSHFWRQLSDPRVPPNIQHRQVVQLAVNRQENLVFFLYKKRKVYVLMGQESPQPINEIQFVAFQFSKPLKVFAHQNAQIQ
jgi:hypothetical protein